MAPSANLINLTRRLGIFLGVLLTAAVHCGVFAAEPARTAPSCKLAPLEGGQSFDLSRYRGKVLYVDFWASWCGPCAQSFPFLNDLNNQYRGKDLHIVGINLDENPEDANGFLTQHPASFNIAADADEQCAKSFGVKAMPSSYLIDRNGVIRHEQLGFRTGETAEIRALVEKLLTEK